MSQEFSVPNVYFPDQLADDATKLSEEYGRSVGHAIQGEWFRKTSLNGSRFYTNRDHFHKLRLYARGEQPVQKYKKEMSVNGDISYLNLDWTPVPIIPKFVDIVVNGMSNRLFEIRADAIDSISSDKKTRYKFELEKAMVAKPILQDAKNLFGMDLFPIPEDEMPQNKQELDLHMEFYKDEIEIAEEKSIENVLKINNYELTKRRLDEDATVLGVSAAKHSFDTHNGIKIEYCDPANMVWSPTEDPTFQDCYYYGEVKNVNITELKKINPSLSQKDIKEISKLASKWDAYQNIQGGNTLGGNLNNNSATLLFFAFKTDMNIVYKKKKNINGGDKVIKRDDSFKSPKTEDAQFEKISKRIDVWFEGVLVLGTNYILKWEVMKNMVRPKSSISKVYPPYVVSAPRMYRGSIDSLVKRMIPFADQIQLTHLKLQQVISSMKPDGVYIDIDGLSSINLGNGNSYTPEEALNLYFQTGSVVGRSFTEDGEFNNGKIPVQELTASGANAKIQSLVNMYNQYLGMIRSVTGLNEARDGSMPDENSLVGIQKLAALNSNTATKHVLQSGLFMTKRIAECICYRMSDVLEYSDIKEDFATMIGSGSIDVLNNIKELHLYNFGIFIDLLPDEEETQMLNQNIQAALASGKIEIDDAIDIRNVKNIKIASQLLKLKKKRKEERDQELQKKNYDSQAASQAQLAQATSQAKMQVTQTEFQTESELEKMKHEMDKEKMQLDFEYKSQLLQMELGFKGDSKQQDLEILKQREQDREDRKDKRTKIQASQQSKLINQRDQKGSPIDFGQDEDTSEFDDLFKME
ncbi:MULTISPECIES: hypothetical protein [Flavobacteriaceae]|uniref:hypothetical protein n=1 Tax=Flavobacteriaceae TaxID=49546 RepID=UPI0025D58E36|nr:MULTISPECIES: hypothetical protein [Flavobacteriaceae]